MFGQHSQGVILGVVPCRNKSLPGFEIDDHYGPLPIQDILSFHNI